MNEIAVFAGSAGVEFATEMCAELGVELKPSRIQRFANDCLEAQLLTNCRQRDVFIVQPLVAPVQENLMELLLMIDAARARGCYDALVEAELTEHLATVAPASCEYAIRDAAGRAAASVRVGERVTHEWSCAAEQPGAFPRRGLRF